MFHLFQEISQDLKEKQEEVLYSENFDTTSIITPVKVQALKQLLQQS